MIFKKERKSWRPTSQVLLVTGGFDGHTAQSTTEVLRSRTSAWEYGPLLPAFLSQLAGANLNGIVYVSGGKDRENNDRDEVR